MHLFLSYIPWHLDHVFLYSKRVWIWIRVSRWNIWDESDELIVYHLPWIVCIFLTHILKRSQSHSSVLLRIRNSSCRPLLKKIVIFDRPIRKLLISFTCFSTIKEKPHLHTVHSVKRGIQTVSIRFIYKELDFFSNALKRRFTDHINKINRLLLIFKDFTIFRYLSPLSILFSSLSVWQSFILTWSIILKREQRYQIYRERELVEGTF